MRQSIGSSLTRISLKWLRRKHWPTVIGITGKIKIILAKGNHHGNFNFMNFWSALQDRKFPFKPKEYLHREHLLTRPNSLLTIYLSNLFEILCVCSVICNWTWHIIPVVSLTVWWNLCKNNSIFYVYFPHKICTGLGTMNKKR